MTTEDPVAQVARAVAARLAGPQHPTLVEDVEVALHHREESAQNDQYVDPTAWGELLLGVANLALAAYTTLKRQTPAPATEVIVRHVRQELTRSDVPALDPAVRDRVVDVTVEETLNAAREAGVEGAGGGSGGAGCSGGGPEGPE
jgi:hypothetical protein